MNSRNSQITMSLITKLSDITFYPTDTDLFRYQSSKKWPPLLRSSYHILKAKTLSINFEPKVVYFSIELYLST